mmetsp:Transcript_14940/g.48303  ORF Transcript_14940/g.48303 Transcript_14940/m.48303 type:complete len:234 (-) Transcript_14940:214-915(-)
MHFIHVLQLFHAALLAAALWASRLRWFLVDALVSSCPPHASLPAHVGVIIGVDEADDLVRVARVARWCADAGINRLTLCDPRGDLLRSVDALRAALTSHCIADLGADLTQPAAAGCQTVAAPRMKLGVVSPQGGRSELVDAARSLCVRAQAGRVSPRSIDEGAVDRQLDADGVQRPEVGLVLQYCHEGLLGGLLPWHTRIAHFVHMGRLRHATEPALHRALHEYVSLNQRHGR